MTLEYRLVDVFAEQPLSGNGLAVVITEEPLRPEFMQRLTCELRQFETIFLVPDERPGSFQARVFTMEEELPFAGHPVLGAGAVLHERFGDRTFSCRLALAAGEVTVESERTEAGYRVTMNQGRPTFGAVIDDDRPWLERLGLRAEDRDRRLPICVASTGLPYLIVPVTAAGLAAARIVADDLEERLAEVGAKFAYIFDVEAREGRTWDNAGLVEDIATGSAAGPVAGVLVRHGLAQASVGIVIEQGRFVGRPSRMELVVGTAAEGVGEILLAGHVCMAATAHLDDSLGA